MAQTFKTANRTSVIGISRAVIVSTSNTTDIPGISAGNVPRGLYVGVSGNVNVIFADDIDAQTVILPNLAAGVWHPMQVRRILADSTTAQNIIVGF